MLGDSCGVVGFPMRYATGSAHRYHPGRGMDWQVFTSHIPKATMLISLELQNQMTVTSHLLYNLPFFYHTPSGILLSPGGSVPEDGQPSS